MSDRQSDERRCPQHEDDESIGADDGTRWVHAKVPGLDLTWNGWQDGEGGLWFASDEEMRREHPEVMAYYEATHP